MSKLTEEQISLLNTPLPDWALSENKFKKVGGGQNMTVINPMAVVDRLNDVFGIDGWDYDVERVGHEPKKVKDKQHWEAAAKGCLTINLGKSDKDKWDDTKRIEQFGGSTNEDLGDAYKGAGTDALTKCASYIGIAATIYKGQGNDQKMEDKKFTDMMDNFIRTHKMVGDPGDLEEMNSTQRYIYDYVRKSINRTKQEK